MGGDPASTWVAKPEEHAEEATTLVKNVAKPIVAKNDNFAVNVNASNDVIFNAEEAVEQVA
ncbi:MAG: hypothetical protein K0S27_97 [Gammaproteobacteria bacterium]|nr:hypothetical protein [Gammaproteobacteria bacterium]